MSLFLEIHEVFRQKPAVIRTHFLSASALAALCGIALDPIGTIRIDENGYYVVLRQKYRPTLIGLEDFGWVQLLWWFDGCDNPSSVNKLAEEKLCTMGPELLGTFATRSPERPNPIVLSAACVTYADQDAVVIGLAWTDAFNGSPVLDIKPYTPSADRVERPEVPDWCAHWPASVEESGDFDWEAEFNF